MQKITVRSDWGYFDELAGKDLKDGERLRVRWPDQSVEEVVIEVVRGEKRGWGGMEEGYSWTYAYAKINHHGAVGKIRLVDFHVLAERI